MNKALKQIFMDVMDLDSVSESDSTENIEAWDSVRHLSLIMAVEDHFGFTFDAAEIQTLTSVKALHEAVKQHTK